MNLPLQSAPVDRYNACNSGYSSIKEGINPAINWGKLAKCAIKIGTLKEHALCLFECRSNRTCLVNCMKNSLPNTKFTPWNIWLNS